MWKAYSAVICCDFQLGCVLDLFTVPVLSLHEEDHVPMHAVCQRKLVTVLQVVLSGGSAPRESVKQESINRGATCEMSTNHVPSNPELWH
ncbi:hypothetical protein Y1Q_0013584 [Alligator mississippiensis]|uniref:Uncharacterized protein n=1 Tax=Alligator mississippiensis TaxID=8496 RepID=A0A151P3B6_ALLMI|nr:hypothetical protein Y1Q_0013584 [Alligator mississippiensis]